jgi:hypothetical protein
MQRMYIVGADIGVAAPFLIASAPTWAWHLLGGGNVFLGVNQGLRSTTVIMKIGLVGRARRGPAMGPNEAAAYLAVALSAFATGTLGFKAGTGPCASSMGRQLRNTRVLEAKQRSSADTRQTLSFFRNHKKPWPTSKARVPLHECVPI